LENAFGILRKCYAFVELFCSLFFLKAFVHAIFTYVSQFFCHINTVLTGREIISILSDDVNCNACCTILSSRSKAFLQVFKAFIYG